MMARCIVNSKSVLRDFNLTISRLRFRNSQVRVFEIFCCLKFFDKAVGFISDIFPLRLSGIYSTLGPFINVLAT